MSKNVIIRTTLARDPNRVDARSGTHPICQEFGPYETAEAGIAAVESLFAKVMQPGETLTCEVLS